MIRFLSAALIAALFLSIAPAGAQQFSTCTQVNDLKCKAFCVTDRAGNQNCFSDCSRRLQACMSPGSYFWLKSNPTLGLRQERTVTTPSGKPQTCGDEAARCTGYCKDNGCRQDCSIRLSACMAPDGWYYWTTQEAFKGLERR